MGTDFGTVDQELVHDLLQGDTVGEVDLVDEVLGVQFLLFLPTLLLILGLEGGLNLPFGPVWEGQDGLVVPPLPVLVDGTHGTSGLDTGGRDTTTIRTTGELHQET